MQERGMVVISSAGRDRGTVLAVLGADEGGLLVADGRRRRIEHPKRKNPRHVRATDQRISEASMATNRELRRALREAGPHITEGG